MIFVKNWQFFHIFNTGKIAQQNVFESIVKRKEVFPDYKNNKLKKSIKLRFFKWVSPWFWPTFVFYLEHYFWPYFDQQQIKKKMEVLAKPWVNPFEKCDFWDFKGMKFLLPKKVSFVSKMFFSQ